MVVMFVSLVFIYIYFTIQNTMMMPIHYVMSYTSRKTPRESGEITQVAGFFDIEEIAEESESSNIRECLFWVVFSWITGSKLSNLKVLYLTVLGSL